MVAKQRRRETPSPTPPSSPPVAEWRHLSTITPWGKNPRKNDPVVPAIVKSIREFGFPSAMVVWPDENLLVAGHTRFKAMSAILAEEPTFALAGSPGPGYVPVRLHSFRDRHHAEAYALADNRLGESAEWDDALLHEIAQDILEHDGIGYMGLLGFDDSEIGSILEGPPMGAEGEGAEGGPSPTATPTGTRPPAGAPSTMRLVQLFLPESGHTEFHSIVAALGPKLGKTEQGDIVLHALRALHEVLP